MGPIQMNPADHYTPSLELGSVTIVYHHKPWKTKTKLKN